MAAAVLADNEITTAVQMILVRDDDYADNVADRLVFMVAQVRRAMTLLGHQELTRPNVFALAV